MMIRPASPDDAAAIATLILPEIAAGETYALPCDMDAAAAVAYWCGADRQTFVLEEEGRLLGSYFLRANQAGGGDHVANAGYMVDRAAQGRGVARAMAHDSFDRARAAGFTAMQFNFVVSSNRRAVDLWQSLGFAIVGRLPGAFRHPTLGPVDALVMFRSL
ncbi:GNAT family N-acetyltransferase [Sphingomonas phyllosphaerae]|uniref:GNAT family N-acetyltransferase n=1 Tax=Sphingomonas phyllosphaerae TaxID=257003 RepID=UPI00041A7572|nr:GNAT family N-acetyltransferase [Sphingomonas phyllosphaerae]